MGFVIMLITNNTTAHFYLNYVIGLTIVLDIAQYEYIPNVGEAAGAVVVVHSPDNMPFPNDEGILAVPGKLTSVGIKRVCKIFCFAFLYCYCFIPCTIISSKNQITLKISNNLAMH